MWSLYIVILLLLLIVKELEIEPLKILGLTIDNGELKEEKTATYMEKQIIAAGGY